MCEDKAITRTENQLPAVPEWAGAMIEQMAQSLRVMAEAIRATNESVETLKRQMQQIVPLTKGQVNALNKQIRQRAADLQEQYRLGAQAERAIAAAIRKDVKLAAGARAIDELPRALYGVYTEQVALWDSYPAMRAIRKKHEGKG